MVRVLKILSIFLKIPGPPHLLTSRLTLVCHFLFHNLFHDLQMSLSLAEGVGKSEVFLNVLGVTTVCFKVSSSTV